MTRKTAAQDTVDEDATQTNNEAGATIAKTETGDGMFGADIELQSLTDSDEGYGNELDDYDDSEADSDTPEDRRKAKIGAKKNKTKFKIVSGEESDSIFEERLQHDAKLEEMDFSDYDDEGWNLDEYNEMNE